MLLLAAEGPPLPELAGWLGIPVWLGGLAFLLWLLLGGRLVRREDCDARVTAAVQAKQLEWDAEKGQADARLTEMSARLTAVVADRDAWRDAHGAEVEARRAAEHAAGKLMETGNLSLALLDALKTQLGRGAST